MRNTNHARNTTYSAPSTGKGVAMAYMCVLAHSRECDGCMECEDRQEHYDNSDSEYENYRDEMYLRREEHDSRYED